MENSRRRFGNGLRHIDLAEDLRWFGEGQPVRARRAGLVRRLWRSVRQRPALLAKSVLAVAALCLAATTFWYVRVAGQLEQHRSEERYEPFAHLRDDAFFYGLLASDRGTFFTGAERDANLKSAELAARKALGLAGVGVEGEARPLGSGFPALRRGEVAEDCCALLFITAEAQSQQPDLAPAERCRTALHILDRADQLGPCTHAYHLRRAVFLRRLGEAEQARNEVERAEAQPPQSSLDHFLSGEENYRRGGWAAARADFNRALAVRPAHFWAQFFLAVCHLRLGEWEAARAGFTA